ncbi:hypothetical protein [Arthrobacter sp. B1805]|uniref:DUF7793 family protein n=1 Tax=Arthrobacter sp. B1805 TaxID=2058892 RepID=UPI000CE4BA80|nr:hypothetical protein [Arthrobacter sp. B1805]
MQRLGAADGRATLTLLARNLQRLEWAERVSISPGDARSVLAASRVLSKGEPYAILVIMTSIVDLPPDARAVFNAEPLVVAAALLGRGPMDEVLAAGACRALHPTRFFLSESSAREWLELSLAARSP